MLSLTSFSSNVYSQGGDDGVIVEIFRRIQPVSRFCVEFGAGDGISCSNTANLWHGAWQAFLVEVNPALYEQAQKNTSGFRCSLQCAKVDPDGNRSIDALLDYSGHKDRHIDFMSIDVDGDDFWIATGLKCRPTVLCIEFNKTIPPHLNPQPTGPGNCYGVGIGTLRPAMEVRGYTFIGLTDTNAYFVVTEHADKFADLEKDLSVLMPPQNFTYLTTDSQGSIVPIGAVPPWGLKWPPSSTVFIANQQTRVLTVDSNNSLDKLRQTMTEGFQDLRRAVEKLPK